MVTLVVDTGAISVPGWVKSIDTFRRWIDTAELPEKARTWFLNGEVWVDMSKEQIFTHVDLKGEITTVLRGLAKASKLGRVLPDGVLLTHTGTGLSGNPDAIYLSADTLASDRVRLIAGKDGGFVELEGTPDMVLEVVSDSSEKKDNQILVEAYWAAGIPEYWVVDGREKDIEFTVFKRGARRYTRTREHNGWVKSAVFGKEFRLTQSADPQGNPEFTLAIR